LNIDLFINRAATKKRTNYIIAIIMIFSLTNSR